MFERIRQFRRMVHDPRFTRSDLLTYAILAFGTPDQDGCHPAETTIAAHTRQDRKTVRGALHHLAELDAVRIERRHAGKRVVGTLYTFPGSTAANGESPPHRPRTMEEITPHRPVETDHPMGENPPPIESPELNRSGPGTGVIDLESEQVARQAQQASTGPWRLENARRVVLAVIGRVGIDPVRAVVAQLSADKRRGAGLRAYDIIHRLEGMTGSTPETKRVPSAIPAESPPPAVQAPPSPVVRRALTLLLSADPATKLRWYDKARGAGARAPMAATAQWISLIAEDYLRAEHYVSEWRPLCCSA
ncbi:hypothetical protein FBY14_12423 [Azospirillum brasilense]|nr:hypothetical protein FBY14_12423 [Azospirillum brasilense]